MIRGSIVALVTPMDESGALDMPALTRLLEWHIAEGTDGIVAVGTTGESATLNVDEHYEVISHTVKTVAGRVPVIGGTGANATAEAIEWTAAAREAGADACLLVTPYYNKPTQRGLYAHYRAIAEAVEIPQILYNVPGRTACDLLPETVAQLARVDNITGIKEATGDLARAAEVMKLRHDGFAVYCGEDSTAMETMLMGADGNISVTANVVPALMHEMCMAAIEGREEDARALNDRLAPLNETLFLESNPIPVKWALQAMGYIGGGIRLPLVPLDKAYQPRLREALQAAGLL